MAVDRNSQQLNQDQLKLNFDDAVEETDAFRVRLLRFFQDKCEK